jgi:hypothetical protein
MWAKQSQYKRWTNSPQILYINSLGLSVCLSKPVHSDPLTIFARPILQPPDDINEVPKWATFGLKCSSAKCGSWWRRDTRSLDPPSPRTSTWSVSVSIWTYPFRPVNSLCEADSATPRWHKRGPEMSRTWPKMFQRQVQVVVAEKHMLVGSSVSPHQPSIASSRTDWVLRDTLSQCKNGGIQKQMQKLLKPKTQVL